MDKQSYTVVGVMPPKFTFPLDGDPPRLWRTFGPEAESTDPKEPAGTTQRGAHYLEVVARLKPGVPIEQAREEMNLMARAMAKQYPDTNKKFPSVLLITELEHLVGNTRPRLILLLVFVGVVLLIASLNVANLLLVRASKRGREIAVRAALGAKQMRVIRQMLTESMVLAIGGAILAIPIALWALKIFIKLNAENLPRLQSAELDGTVLGFTAFFAVVTSFVFGLAPALRARQTQFDGIFGNERQA